MDGITNGIHKTCVSLVVCGYATVAFSGALTVCVGPQDTRIGRQKNKRLVSLKAAGKIWKNSWTSPLTRTQSLMRLGKIRQKTDVMMKKYTGSSWEMNEEHWEFQFLDIFVDIVSQNIRSFSKF